MGGSKTKGLKALAPKFETLLGDASVKYHCCTGVCLGQVVPPLGHWVSSRFPWKFMRVLPGNWRSELESFKALIDGDSLQRWLWKIASKV